MFQTPLGFSNVSAFSACSAVKLGGIVISLEKSIVPNEPNPYFTLRSFVLVYMAVRGLSIVDS